MRSDGINYRLAAVGMRRPMAAEHPSDAGDADCHVAVLLGRLLAMTVVFVIFPIKSAANRNIKDVIASQCAHWRGNPFPSMRSVVSPLRGDNVTHVNDNFLTPKKPGAERFCAGEIFRIHRCLPRKNTTSTPGPVWAPMTPPTWPVSTFFTSGHFSRQSFSRSAASSGQSPWPMKMV